MRPDTWKVLTLALLASVAACRAEAPSGCDTQGIATIGLGRAISHLRAARAFADTPARLEALDALEARMAAQIDADPDSSARGAAWLSAEASGAIFIAATELAEIDRVAHVVDSTGAGDYDTQRAALRAETYRRYMSQVANEIDPEAVDACAAPAWASLRDAAFSTGAL
jgi:hypothetical protein